MPAELSVAVGERELREGCRGCFRGSGGPYREGDKRDKDRGFRGGHECHRARIPRLRRHGGADNAAVPGRVVLHMRKGQGRGNTGRGAGDDSAVHHRSGGGAQRSGVLGYGELHGPRERQERAGKGNFRHDGEADKRTRAPRRAGKVRKAGEPRVTRDEFIEGNLPLVHKLANRFRGRGVEYEELYAAGCVGLVKAVDRFEPERGLCFSTYAVPVILGEIRRLFRDGGSVKISRSLKELSVKAARLRDQLSANGEPRISDIAQALGVTPEEAAEALCAGIPPVSLDHGGEDGEPLPVPSASGEDALIDRLALRQCLSELSGEDREILMLRYFRRKTQSETAQILGMTQVMVSRRERKLLKELREQLV